MQGNSLRLAMIIQGIENAMQGLQGGRAIGVSALKMAIAIIDGNTAVKEALSGSECRSMSKGTTIVSIIQELE